MTAMEINEKSNQSEWERHFLTSPSTRFFLHQPLKPPRRFSSSSSQAKMASPKFNKSKSSQSALVWDCGSSLYDSFELNSLKRQLDSAIASRSLSMPHLPGRRCLPPPPPLPPSKRPSKISRSLHKFLRSVFRHKPNSSPSVEANPERADAGYYVLYGDDADPLSANPEVGFPGFSPEIGSLVRRTASERFTAATSMGISCA